MGFTPSTGFGRAMACCGAQALVPGDGVERSAGNLVPTDARVLAATDFFVNQAALTGEAFPVEKQVDDTPAEVPGLLGARHAVFMGSTVVSGSAHLLVCATGARTGLGRASNKCSMAPGRRARMCSSSPG